MPRFVFSAPLLALVLLAPDLAAQDPCPYRAAMALDRRRSPLDSLTFPVDGHPVKICYGRPSARGRTMIGGQAAPYGRVWRTGANETTKIMTPVPLSVAGIEVPAGTYALYTVPGESEWEIIVNRSYRQWGREDTYSDSVRAQELGRATVRAERLKDPIETFTIRAEPEGNGATVILEWEKTRVRVPVVARHMR